MAEPQDDAGHSHSVSESEDIALELDRTKCTEEVIAVVCSTIPKETNITELAAVLLIESLNHRSFESVIRMWRDSQPEPAQVSLSALRNALSHFSQISLTLTPERLIEATKDLVDSSESDVNFSIIANPPSRGSSTGSYTADHSGTSLEAKGERSPRFYNVTFPDSNSHKKASELVTGVISTRSFGPTKPSDDEICALKKEVVDLQKKFASLVRRVYKLFDSQSIEVKEVKVYLQSLLKPEKVGDSLFPNSMLQIIEKKDMHEAFMFLTQYEVWNFLNFRFLWDVFEEFIEGDRTEMVRRFDDYASKLKEFKQSTPLLHFLAIWDGRAGEHDIPGHKALIVKLLDDSDTVTIEEASRRAHLLADQFSLKDLAFKLRNGSVGCLYVMWLVPAAMSKRIHTIMKDPVSRPDLLKLGVLELAVERQIFQFCVDNYESLHQLSLNLPHCFWSGIGAEGILWRQKSREVYNFNRETGEFHFFRGAKLNVSENCLDVHVRNNPDKVALIWERDDTEEAEKVTYRSLLHMTCQIANVLMKKGIRKGDVVVVYMPTMPIAVAAMLACVRIGAIHCAVYSDFNHQTLLQRIKEVGAKAIITADQRVAGGQTTNLLSKVMTAVSNVDCVETVFVVNRSNTTPTVEKAVENTLTTQGARREQVVLCSLEKEMESESVECEPVEMNAEDILFISYTSGTQGNNTKAVYFPQAGFLIYNKLTFKFIFDPGPGDIIGCFSDIGWLGAHCFVLYGPLSNGCTTLLFNSCASYPNTNRYWEVIDKLQITHFQTVPSVLNTLHQAEKELGHPHQHKSLKYIGTAGGPLPPDTQKWFYEEVGKKRCFFADTWGQTEIGGIGIMRWECPNEMKRKHFPASKSFALFGADLGSLPKGTSKLYLKKPLPGMGKSLIISGSGHDEKIPFEAKHYNSATGFSTGDLIEYDSETEQMRVSGRENKAVFIKGAWLSIKEIGDDIKRNLRSEIQGVHVEIIKCSQKCSTGSVAGRTQDLFVVVQPDNDLTITSVDSLLADTIKSSNDLQDLSKAGFKIWSFIMRKREQVKKFLQTVSGKHSLSLLEKFITETVLPHLRYRPYGVHDLDGEKMLKFFEANSLCNCHGS